MTKDKAVTKPQRDAKGQYLPGHSGNKRGATKGQQSYRRILLASCSPTEWKAIVKKAVKEAKGGNRFAREWLGNYLVGKAPDTTIHEMGEDMIMTLEKWQARASARLATVENLEVLEAEIIKEEATC